MNEKESGVVDIFEDDNLTSNDNETPVVEEKAPRNTRKKTRIPIATRNVLRADEREGFHRRFFNDKDDRIARAEAAGYVKVRGNVSTGDPHVGDSSKKGSCVTKSVGGGMKAYLMELPQEFYDEDQKVKQDAIDETEKGMTMDSTKAKDAGSDGRYGKIAIG